MLMQSFDRLRNVLDALRTRLWLIPAVMSLLAAVLARMLVRLGDSPLFNDLEAWWYFGGDASTARNLLSTLLSGMITMTALVISITMVVLSLAAAQLGPRLIWNFIRDRQIQAVIGLFFGTIFYLLVVLRSVAVDRVPDVAVTAGTALVGLCLFALLFHVHKVAKSIIADEVVSQVARSLLNSVNELPEDAERPSFDKDRIPDLPNLTRVSTRRSGYVQVIEYKKLTHLAAKHDLALDVRVRAGHFVLASGEHVEVHHRAVLAEEIREAIGDAFLIGSQRTKTQDVEYSVRQLVEIAVRALSPGINDPFTAITVVSRLGQAVERLTSRSLPERLRCRDERGVLRVIAETGTFDGIVHAAFDQIRQAAASRGNAAVLIAMGSMLGQLGAAVRNGEQAGILRHHLSMVERAAQRAIEEESDRADFEMVYAEASQRLTHWGSHSGGVETEPAGSLRPVAVPR